MERKSVRVPFDPNRPISKENLEHILEAARWAPTGHNMQNYEIMVVDDRAVLGRISSTKSCVLEDFLRDNYGHLSFSEKELKHKKTGILSAGFRRTGLTQPNLAKSRALPQYRLVIPLEGARLF